MKSVKNRIGNAILLSFMATVGWLAMGLAMYSVGNAELFDILNIVCVMFLVLLLVFGILFFMCNDLDLLVNG